uniref:Leucine rich repeat containing 3C n=1 Tax=Cyprinodon variegatus TaxID=28743 RepID=A0A3Q2EDT8_CYPVA
MFDRSAALCDLPSSHVLLSEAAAPPFSNPPIVPPRGGTVALVDGPGEWVQRPSQMCLSLQIPAGLPNHTTHLFLNKNRLTSLPAFCFSDLFLLDELDLSHNQLSFLEPGCFSGLVSSLRYLDLSSNLLTTLDPVVLGGLQVQANLSQNPWHCDCSMQVSLGLREELPKVGAVGLPLVVLMQDWDLCQSVRRTTDFLTLITMFLWFGMLIAYLIHYIRHNEVFARRHLDKPSLSSSFYSTIAEQDFYFK